jgi:uncharacterized membrane protein
MAEVEQIAAAPTQDECTFAVLAHALQTVGWWIAPLIIFIVKRQSRFVSFHALQALLLQGVYFVCFGVFGVLWMVIVFATIAQTQASHSNAPRLAVFIVFPLIWLFGMGFWVFTIVIVIMYSIKAGRGEWAEYPVLGKWARRILKIGPGGSLVPTG